MRISNLQYEAWLHWVVTERCVMNCEYCRTGGGEDSVRRKAPAFPIDIPNLISTLEQTGKIFNISFTGGGEPFLVPNLTEACLELSKKHYISFYTNFAEKQVREFLEQIDPGRVLYILASCHIKALERRQLLERFIRNCVLCKAKGIPLTVAEVAYPPLLSEVEKYTRFFAEHGLDLKFGPFDGEYQGKTYPQSYTDEELETFGLAKLMMTLYDPSSGNNMPFCNAGYNAAIVRPNGDINPCDQITQKIGNIYTQINFRKHIVLCPFTYCGCQLYHHDSNLFEHAKQKDIWFIRQVVWSKRIRDYIRRWQHLIRKRA